MTNPILYETSTTRIARIILNRPETRNAQDTAFLYALNEAFDRAALDDGVKVIVLSANGPHFSSGHDLREVDGHGNMKKHATVGTWGGLGRPGAEAQYAREQEIYVGFCERWRNIPKPTLALVQGKVIAGGLMLIWPCDLIVASEDAEFLDHTVAMGVGGAEFFAHPWEMGVRKAKEFLFTADWMGAAEAHRLGMVNHVVPRAELEIVRPGDGRAHRPEAAVRAQARQAGGECRPGRAGPGGCHADVVRAASPGACPQHAGARQARRPHGLDAGDQEA